MRLKEEEKDKRIKLVVGNTSAGIYTSDEYDLFIDVSIIPELLVLKIDQDEITVGAAVTIQNLIQFLERQQCQSPEVTRRGLKAIHDHLQTQIAYSPAKPPVFSIDEALSGDSPSVFAHDQIVLIPSLTREGSDEYWLNEATKPLTEDGMLVCGSQITPGQAHFYMETQCAIAVPGEESTFHLFCSTQSPSTDQSMAALALRIPTSHVQVSVRRIGGGFGGKQFRTGFISAAVAVAARTLNKPVKLALTREEDMLMIGKRHPFAARSA